jgi:hypothetical protein
MLQAFYVRLLTQAALMSCLSIFLQPTQTFDLFFLLCSERPIFSGCPILNLLHGECISVLLGIVPLLIDTTVTVTVIVARASTVPH